MYFVCVWCVFCLLLISINSSIQKIAMFIICMLIVCINLDYEQINDARYAIRLSRLFNKLKVGSQRLGFNE